jgi:hypothetical protein
MTELSDTNKFEDLDLNEHASNAQEPEINMGNFIQKYGNNIVKMAPFGGFPNEIQE